MSAEIPLNISTAELVVEPQVVVAEIESRGRELTPVGLFALDGEPLLTLRGSQIAHL